MGRPAWGLVCCALLACGPTAGSGADAGDLDGARADATGADSPLDADAASCTGWVRDPWRIEEATPSPDGEGWCCQPGYPTCDCGYFGGFVHDRCVCGGVPSGIIGENPYGDCDLAPPDWILETDEHGCMRYRARSSTTACCNCFDAGTELDASTDDAA